MVERESASEKVVNVIPENSRKRRARDKAPAARPGPGGMPEGVAKFMHSIPSLTIDEAKEQTSAKVDRNFEAVLSKIYGDSPVKRAPKSSGS